MRDRTMANRRRNQLEALHRLAARQMGLVTKDQARTSGFTDRQIQGCLERSEWRRIIRGVFLIGATEVTWKARALAICLGAGPGVAASHRTAAALLELDGFPSSTEKIHATSLRRVTLKHPQLVIHHTQRPFDVRTAQGIPITCVERTLLDVASSATVTAMELALEDALRRRLTTVDRLLALIERDGGRGQPGSRTLSVLLRERGSVAATESALETQVARALEEAALPGLVRQHPFIRADGSRGRIDFAIPELKIAIEVDSYRWHSGRSAWHRDIARRNELTAQGWVTLQATKEDAADGCRRLLATLEALIAERAS